MYRSLYTVMSSYKDQSPVLYYSTSDNTTARHAALQAVQDGAFLARVVVRGGGIVFETTRQHMLDARRNRQGWHSPDLKPLFQDSCGCQVIDMFPPEKVFSECSGVAE